MFRNRKVPPNYYTKSALKLLFGGAIAFPIYEYISGNEKFHREIVIPIVHKIFDPENAHRAAILTAKYGMIPPKGSAYKNYEELKINVFDLPFQNPIGLAAGFDKNADAVICLSRYGFGFVEIGSVTPLPQDGNEPPRVFRLTEDEGVINRYGFNSSGHVTVFENLTQFRNAKSSKHCFVGVNLGKNKTSINPNMDFSLGVERLGPVADYIVVNISSPNTPGLRDLQHKRELEDLLKSLKSAKDGNPKIKSVPLLLKISPDLTWQEKCDVAAVCNNKNFGVDGLIISNTTISRPEFLKSSFKMEIGGLSGKPLKKISTDCVRDFRKLTKGKIPIVAAGGISSGEDAYEKIRAGASLVQIYTALVYQGFPVVGRIKRELSQCLIRDGFSNVKDAIGVDCPIK